MATSKDDSGTAFSAASTAASIMNSQQDAITATKSSSSQAQALHRHPSITTSGNNNPNPPPHSPALSTTSKASSIHSARSHSNSSSCGNSTSGSSRTNNMSVDDILSNPALSMKRRRKVRDTATANNYNNSIHNRGGGGRGSSTANSALQRQTTASATNANTTATKFNPGQGQRKKRLERLQREQLVQRRLLGQQQQQQQQQNSEVGRKLFQQQHSTNEAKAKVAHSTKDQTNNGDLPTTTMTNSKRRSPRLSTTMVTTYNISELSKNGISNEFSTDACAFATAAATTGSSEQSSKGETNTKKEEGGDHNDDNLNDTIQNPPTTVESALSSLLSNYKSCISTTNYDNSPAKNQDETETTEKHATTEASTAVSPWSVIQVLPQLLQFVNLKQTTTSTTTTSTTTGINPSTKSGAEQEKQQFYIQKELSKVVSSVAMMKRRVMNRTVGLENSANDGNNNDDDEEAAAAQQQQLVAMREASLLQMIQIQVWIRMMIWSLEGEAGWTYLEEVVNLTDEKDGDDGDKSDKKQNKKKKKKKKKGKRKQLVKDASGVSTTQEQQTPRQALVDHLTALFELVPYVLPPSMDFSVCVKDILTFGYRQNVPKYGTEILDHFEIELVEPIALKRSGTDTSLRSTRSEVSHSPVKNGSTTDAGGTTSPSRQIAERRAKRQQAYFASLMEEEKAASASTSINADDESATITGSISTVTSTSRGSKRSRGPDIEKDDTKLLKTSMSLTAAVKPKSKENPFLKGSARGAYVGSHLSSKLSNISTLFREVTVPVKKPKMRRTTPTASLLFTNKRKTAAPKEKKRKGEEAGPKAPFNITAKVTREQLNVSEKTRIRETPTKKFRVDRTSFHSGRADTYPPLSTPRRIIEETPAKLSRRVVISETPQPQPRFRRQQLDYLSDGTRHHQQGKRSRNRQHTSNNTNNDGLSPMIQYGGLSPMPQKKNVVADAAKAAARKRK